MLLNWRRTLRWMAAAMGTVYAVAASSADIRSCEEPRVFRDTPVNVLILPYTYTGPDQSRPLSESARLLGILMEQDSLIDMVKYGSIAVVNLVNLPGSHRPCVPDEIWERMAGSRRDPNVGARPGAGVVMMWGRLYEESGSLFIQSYIRFGRVQTNEQIERSVSYGEKPLVFRGALPAQSVTLPPREIREADLRAIAKEFGRAAVIYEKPDPSSRVVGQLPDPNRAAANANRFEPFGYTVTSVDGDWMRVNLLYGGGSGWVRARVDVTQWPLRDRLPEMHYLDGVVGYLQYRVAVDPSPFRRSPPPSKFIDLAQRSFARYAERTPSGTQPSARSLGHAMIGALKVLEARSSSALDGADAQFSEAVRLAPYSADLRNLQNVVQVQRCCLGAGRAGADSKAMMDRLLDAVAVDPENAQALENLLSFHKLLKQWPEGAVAIGPEELERQASALASAGIRQ